MFTIPNFIWYKANFWPAKETLHVILISKLTFNLNLLQHVFLLDILCSDREHPAMKKSTRILHTELRIILWKQVRSSKSSKKCNFIFICNLWWIHKAFFKWVLYFFESQMPATIRQPFLHSKCPFNIFHIFEKCVAVRPGYRRVLSWKYSLLRLLI